MPEKGIYTASFQLIDLGEYRAAISLSRNLPKNL
jgi:hypothetical protein